VSPPHCPDGLPSSPLAVAPISSDVGSVSQHLINNSMHRMTGAAASQSLPDNSPDSPNHVAPYIPGGVTLAAAYSGSRAPPGADIAAQAQKTNSDMEIDFKALNSNAVGTMPAVPAAFPASVPASPSVSKAGSSTQLEGDVSDVDDVMRSKQLSPGVWGPRHVFKIEPISEGDALAEQGDSSALQQCIRSMREVWGRTGDVPQGDCRSHMLTQSGFGASSGGCSIGADCSAAPAVSDPASGVMAVNGGEEGGTSQTEQGLYMTELLQLRGVVEALAQHLDLMITSTESSMADSSES
jgi:hypothetical protein